MPQQQEQVGKNNWVAEVLALLVQVSWFRFYVLKCKVALCRNSVAAQL